MNLIRPIVQFFFPVEPVIHPFKLQEEDNTQDIDNKDIEVVQPENVIKHDWGNGEVDTLVKNFKDGGFEYSQLLDPQKKRLPGQTLDKFDWDVIRQYNNDPTKKQKLVPAKYKLVKPYVLANWTNTDIAAAFDMSKSWAERYCPRVRDAIKLRNK